MDGRVIWGPLSDPIVGISDFDYAIFEHLAGQDSVPMSISTIWCHKLLYLGLSGPFQSLIDLLLPLTALFLVVGSL